ncbi:MAG TPA: hypothetical protein VGC13_06810 [Longimicrobium sp.]
MTFNTRDFPRRAVARYGIEVRRPDAFVLDLLGRHPEEVYAVARRHRSELRKPPKTVEQYLDHLSQSGLKRSAEYLREAGVDL